MSRRAAAQEQAHRVTIGDTQVELVLRRSARRSFALQVDHRGVRVAVPLRTPLGEVDRFVHQHGAWLLDRLRQRAQQPVAAPLQVREGACLPVLGESVTIRLHGGRKARWGAMADGGEALFLPLAADPARAAVGALKARALTWYVERVGEYCARLGLAPPPVRLSNARTRWGSCSSRSGIRLHWRLIHLPPALSDYVIAHEVAHLREMNHSPRFWAVVGELYPAWRSARAELRAAARGMPEIALVPPGGGDPLQAEDSVFTSNPQ